MNHIHPSTTASSAASTGSVHAVEVRTSNGTYLVTRNIAGFGTVSLVHSTRNQLGEESLVPVAHTSWITNGTTVVFDADLAIPAEVLAVVVS